MGRREQPLIFSSRPPRAAMTMVASRWLVAALLVAACVRRCASSREGRAERRQQRQGKMQRPQRKEVALAARRPAPRRIRVVPPGRGGAALGADPAVLAAAPAFGARPSPAFELCGDLARHVAPPAPANFNASSALARTLVLVVSGKELHRARLGPLRCAWARRVPRWVVVSDACVPGMATVRARKPGDRFNWANDAADPQPGDRITGQDAVELQDLQHHRAGVGGSHHHGESFPISNRS